MKLNLAISEKELIVGLNNGSARCFTELYNKWIDPLYDFVFQLVKSEKLTDDIVQETFISVWNYRETLQIRTSFKAYLFRIAYHLIVKEIKRQIQNPLMEEYINYTNEPSVSEKTVTQCIDFDQFVKDYENAKKDLTPRQLQIFILNKEQECSIKEIAEKLSISEQSVKNQLLAASKIMRSDLKKYRCLLWVLLGI